MGGDPSQVLGPAVPRCTKKSTPILGPDRSLTNTWVVEGTPARRCRWICLSSRAFGACCGSRDGLVNYFVVAARYVRLFPGVTAPLDAAVINCASCDSSYRQ